MNPAERLRQSRHDAGLTQAELAERAGVSRALISAVEAGRHLPRVDAALALATALGATAESLFGSASPEPVDALSGRLPERGTPIRLGFVGGRAVSAEPRLAGDGWEIVDGVVGSLDAELLRGGGASLVIAGCEPGLVVMERLLREDGTRALAIGASSALALAALDAGRLHAAVVHFPEGERPVHDPSSQLCFHLVRWRVGLAAPPDAKAGWQSDALAGRGPVIQREAGASAQKAFERALLTADGPSPTVIDGPIVGGHLAAARQSLATGLPAVTIEPAAAAVGAAFHPLETHEVELRIATERATEPGVRRLLDLLTGPALRRTLESVGGYDLTGLGSRAA